MPKAAEETDAGELRKIAFYESARDEMINRIKLRDQSLIAYIATAGAYFGFIVEGRGSGPPEPTNLALESSIVVVLPILSLVFTYVILQHHVMIGKLGEYTRTIFDPETRHWDHTYAGWIDKRYLSARTISQALLLIMPLAYTALFVFRTRRLVHSLSDELISTGVLLFDIGVLGVIVWLQAWAIRLRRATDYVGSTSSAKQLFGSNQ